MEHSDGRASRAVATIAAAQLLGTSLWFSVNAAADDLARVWAIGPAELGLLTSAVQLGFITGTLLLALSGLADRVAASRIFVAGALLGAGFNLAFVFGAQGLSGTLALRFLVGLCLAGIYPMGMKLIVAWAPARAGSALALLVAMLTLGTALPHGLRHLGSALSWQLVMTATSLLAVVAALMVGLLGDGPHAPRAPHSGKRLPVGPAAIWQAFSAPDLRAAALGYFGHMWELYAFWTLVPALIARADLAASLGVSASAVAFAVIASGALGCLLGGRLSRRVGSARVAAMALALSGACCLVCAALGNQLPAPALALLLLVWGLAVVADSPQFSALSAQACPPQQMGSVLAIQNALGFAISVAAISLCSNWVEVLGLQIAWLLMPGPILGLWLFLRRKR